MTGEFPAQTAIQWRHHVKSFGTHPQQNTTKRKPCVYFSGCAVFASGNLVIIIPGHGWAPIKRQVITWTLLILTFYRCIFYSMNKTHFRTMYVRSRSCLFKGQCSKFALQVSKDFCPILSVIFNDLLSVKGIYQVTGSHGTFWWSWWRHQMETFSALLAICAGNSPVTGEFPPQRPVTRSFDVFFDLRLNILLNNQDAGDFSCHRSGSLWRHCNDNYACRWPRYHWPT